MSKLSRNEALAEAMREMSAELDEQRKFLEQILEAVVTTADGLNEHRAHTLSQVNDMGTKQHEHGRRLEALEKVAGRGD